MLNVTAQLRRGDFALDIAFQQTGRISGVFGPSGAGKSTLMHVIAGLASPDSGRIELNGETLWDSVRRINVPAHRRRIGVMFQDDRLFPHMNVRQNLLYGRKPPTNRVLLAPVEDWEFVRLLGLSDLLSRRISTLSGGERQRVALGRALLSQPRLLLLDEPLSSLDAALKAQILPYLRKVRDVAGIPMLYVSHDLTEMLQITDHLLLLERGGVAGHGPFSELAHQHAALDALRDCALVNVIACTIAARGAEGGIDLLLESRDLGASRAPSSAPVLRAAMDVPAQAGEAIAIAIRASDIAIALQQVQGVSIQNQVRGEVKRLTPHRGRVIVDVNIGIDRALLAELTPRAVESLALAPGKTVWCLIKSNAIRPAQ